MTDSEFRSLIMDEEILQECVDELKDVFVKMSYALVGIEGGTKAFDLLINAVLDKYPHDIQIEACKRLISELHIKEMERRSGE